MENPKEIGSNARRPSGPARDVDGGIVHRDIKPANVMQAITTPRAEGFTGP